MPVVNMCADSSMWAERALGIFGPPLAGVESIPDRSHPTNYQTPANRDALQLQPVPKDV
jgi:hypothetical protein